MFFLNDTITVDFSVIELHGNLMIAIHFRAPVEVGVSGIVYQAQTFTESYNKALIKHCNIIVSCFHCNQYITEYKTGITVIIMYSIFISHPLVLTALAFR